LEETSLFRTPIHVTHAIKDNGAGTGRGRGGVMVYDVGNNNSKAGLRNIAHFVNNKSYTNNVLMGVPHRFDLPDTSCVNKEVESFNNKLT